MVESKKQILEEYTKCVQDKTRIYMIENYLKTFDAVKGDTVPFKLFPKQKLYCKNLSENVNNITSKYRQSGITTVTCAIFACNIALAAEGKPERALLIANNLKQANENLAKLKDFLTQLPWWFWGEEYKPEKDGKQKSIFTKENETKLNLVNGCEVFSRSSGPNSSRGCSAISLILFDECAFMDRLETITSAISTAASSAKIITFVSTPNGKDQIYYPIYDRAKKGEVKEDGLKYTLTEFFWHQDPRYNKNLRWVRTNKDTGQIETFVEPTLNKDGDVEYNEEHWDDMLRNGYKAYSTWYDKMCSYYNYNKQQISQELDVSFIGSAGTVIDEEITSRHEKINTREPLYTDNFFKEAWIYKEPIGGHRYFMTIDVATGSGADSSVIQIFDVDYIDDNGLPNIEQVFEYQGKIQGDILGELANQYGRYYGNALAIVDCIGSSGDACVLKLQELGYPNLYYDDPNLKKVTSEEEGKYDENKSSKMPGFRLSSVRLQMIMNLEKMLRFNEVTPRSKRFTQELTTFIWKNGRPDHQSGYHDDTITAMAMGLFVFQFSFKKLEAVKEKTKAILSSMILVQNVINNTATQKLPENKIPLPFFTQKALDKKLNQNKPINPYTAMNVIAMQQIFGR